MNEQKISVSTSEYRDLPLSQLQESPNNPRKRYSETSLQELAESIKAQGVLAPLLVRELETDRFEIIAGSRRFRAAQIAGGGTVPVRVVSLSDTEAQIAMAIENLQREDIHPLEEARAFANLMEQGMDPATIAAKIGKLQTFIVQRMRLTTLIEPIAEAFLEEKITVGHALLIGKLPPAQQPEAFTVAFRSVYLLNGQASVLVPVRELASWIDSNLLLDLDRAPFDKSDPALFPEAGTVCSVRNRRASTLCCSLKPGTAGAPTATAGRRRLIAM